jgi:hypothetical protein
VGKAGRNAPRQDCAAAVVDGLLNAELLADGSVRYVVHQVDIYAWWALGSIAAPYLDQNALFDQIDFQQPINQPSLTTVATEPLPVFLCVSDGDRMTDPSDPLVAAGFSRINYRGNGGNDTGELAADGTMK